MEMLEILSQLTAIPGPPGLEGPVVSRAGALLAPFVDYIETDRMGNLLGIRSSGRTRARVLMLDAHLDEVGFVVAGFEEGYLRLRATGGVDPRVLPGRVLSLCTQPPRIGVVACQPPHVQDTRDAKNQEDTAIPLDELLLDVGLSENDARANVPVGVRAVFTGETFALGARQASGHAFDNRAGFAVLLRTMELLREQPLNVDLVVLGSVQEEVGTRGAATAAFAMGPEACVVVDVTHAHMPDAPRHKTFALGGGPCVGVGPGCHRLMSSGLIEIAKANAIPCQVEVMEGHTGTNSWPVQVTGYGVSTAMVSIPLKYMHTPVETLCLDDMEHTAQLLTRYIQSLEGEV